MSRTEGYALTGPERAKRAEERRVAAGGRVVRLILRPDATAALDTLMARGSPSMLAAVEAALIAAAKQPTVDTAVTGP